MSETSTGKHTIVVFCHKSGKAKDAHDGQPAPLYTHLFNILVQITTLDNCWLDDTRVDIHDSHIIPNVLITSLLQCHHQAKTSICMQETSKSNWKKLIMQIHVPRRMNPYHSSTAWPLPIKFQVCTQDISKPNKLHNHASKREVLDLNQH